MKVTRTFRLGREKTAEYFEKKIAEYANYATYSATVREFDKWVFRLKELEKDAKQNGYRVVIPSVEFTGGENDEKA